MFELTRVAHRGAHRGAHRVGHRVASGRTFDRDARTD
jgi:hypothetical protein